MKSAWIDVDLGLYNDKAYIIIGLQLCYIYRLGETRVDLIIKFNGVGNELMKHTFSTIFCIIIKSM